MATPIPDEMPNELGGGGSEAILLGGGGHPCTG